jgi:hypothetical protein
MSNRWPLLMLRLKGQRSRGQTGHMSVWLINILRTLCLTDFKLCRLVHQSSWEVDDHDWFWGPKVKGSNWTEEYTDHSISWELFAWQTSNFIDLYIMESRWTLQILRLKGQGSNWTYEYTDHSTSWEPFPWQTSNFVHCTS